MGLSVDDAYRADVRRWASVFYKDSTVANASAEAFLTNLQDGRSMRVATVSAHRAAVTAGGEYRCHPDRVAKAILVCFLFGLLFIPATMIGLSANPSPAGYLFLAVFGGGPALGVVGLILVKVNSYFFVNSHAVGRRNFMGRVVTSIPRADVRDVAVGAGSWKNVYGSLNRDMEGPDESKIFISAQGRGTLTARLYWWTDDRMRVFAAVARP